VATSFAKDAWRSVYEGRSKRANFAVVLQTEKPWMRTGMFFLIKEQKEGFYPLS